MFQVDQKVLAVLYLSICFQWSRGNSYNATVIMRGTFRQTKGDDGIFSSASFEKYECMI